MGIAIVQAYTWKTTYAGLMPDEVIDARINRLMENAEKIAQGIEEGEHFLTAK